MGAVVGPGEVQAAADAAVAVLTSVLEPSAVRGSRAQWAAAAGAAQRVIDVAAAVQDAAIVRLAAIEPQWLEDGTEVETHRGLGHVALDAPAILSGVLAISAVHAERRVGAAVLLAADGPEGTGTDSGLGGLHTAMAAGRLDSYRASVVAQELEAAPAPVRATVVAMLQAHLESEDGARLRRRCRRALARISPDLLVERAKRARAACGLRRWVEEPGVDRWEGTFPSEDAAKAWAAIDALARRYVADGSCSPIEAARGKALTDLVAGNATIDTTVTLTVPAAAVATVPPSVAGSASANANAAADPPNEAPAHVGGEGTRTVGGGDLVEVTGPSAGDPLLVSRRWLTHTLDTAATVRSRTVPPAHRRPARPRRRDPAHRAGSERTSRSARPGRLGDDGAGRGQRRHADHCRRAGVEHGGCQTARCGLCGPGLGRRSRRRADGWHGSRVERGSCGTGSGCLSGPGDGPGKRRRTNQPH